MDAAERRALLASVQRSAEQEGWTAHVPTWPEAARRGRLPAVLNWRPTIAVGLVLIALAAFTKFKGVALYFSGLGWKFGFDLSSNDLDELYDRKLSHEWLSLLFASSGVSLLFVEFRVRQLLEAPRRLLWRRKLRRSPALVIDRSAAIDPDTPGSHEHLLLLEDSNGEVFEVTTNRRTRRKLPPGTAIYAFLHGGELLEYRRYRPQ